MEGLAVQADRKFKYLGYERAEVLACTLDDQLSVFVTMQCKHGMNFCSFAWRVENYQPMNGPGANLIGTTMGLDNWPIGQVEEWFCAYRNLDPLRATIAATEVRDYMAPLVEEYSFYHVVALHHGDRLAALDAAWEDLAVLLKNYKTFDLSEWNSPSRGSDYWALA